MNTSEQDRDEVFMIQMGFTTLEIAKVRQIQSRRFARLQPGQHPGHQRVDACRDHDYSLPFMDLRPTTHTSSLQDGPYHWRNWIVMNLYREHFAGRKKDFYGKQKRSA